MLITMLLLVGCSNDSATPVLGPENRPVDTEPTSNYGWMAGECPFSPTRIGRTRRGFISVAQAVGPNGTYFIENAGAEPSFIVYADHGSDTFVKLCGRVDCTHSGPDCNAYLYKGSCLSFYRGYLYAVVGGTAASSERCELIRMEPDGSDHVTILDLNDFAKENGAEYAEDVRFFEENCTFYLMDWESKVDIDGSESYTTKVTGIYSYKLDGSIGGPVKRKRAPSYYSGDMLYCIGPAQNSESINGVWTIDIESDTETFVVDQLGVAGLYMLNEVYYFKDGAIRHLEYATNEETVIVETGLDHDYYLFTLPDCLVLADKSKGDGRDPNLYIYNWAFELVDTVELTYDFNGRTQFMLIAETAEKLILTDSSHVDAIPKYYIDKAELGTGNVQIHEFKYA